MEDEADRKEIDAAWAEEVERRVSAFRAGELQAISGDQVFAEIDRILRGESVRETSPEN